MKKKLLSAVLVLIFSFNLVACGQAVSDTYDSSYASLGFAEDSVGKEGAYITEDSYDYGMEATQEVSTANELADTDLEGYDFGQKIVYSSDISLESKNYDDDIAAVRQLVSSNRGYFSSTSESGNVEYGNRFASFTARVPSENYDTFMTSVGDVGSLTYKSEYVDDITSEYVDVQARLQSLNTKLERLQELEANAADVTELLEIEDRINEVQYEIESYTAQMKVYDSQVEYSTITISVSEVVTYTEPKADTLLNRIAEAFSDSFSGFISFLQNLLINIIYLLPYLIIIIVIIVIIIVARRKKKAKKAKKIQEDSGREQS